MLYPCRCWSCEASRGPTLGDCLALLGVLAAVLAVAVAVLR